MNIFLRTALPTSAVLALTLVSAHQADAVPMPASPIVFDAPTRDDIPQFADIDADGNARLSPIELSAWFVTDDPKFDLVEFLDADGDGEISANEFDALVFEPVE